MDVGQEDDASKEDVGHVVLGRFYVRGLYRERIVNVVVLTIG